MFELGQNRKIAALKTSICVCFLIFGDKMDEIYMKEALKEAKKAYLNDDVPVGAIIVKNNKIIARAYNKKQKNGIATEHAEILAINKACKKLKTWRLNDCTMYISLEPCLMCAGAIIQSRISKIVYACKNEKFGYVNSIDSVLNNKKNNHQVIIETGLLHSESQKLLRSFFKNKRQ